MAREIDFKVTHHGSVAILAAMNEAAQDWVDEHLGDELQHWAGGIAVEPRYLPAILDGIEQAGFTIGR